MVHSSISNSSDYLKEASVAVCPLSNTQIFLNGVAVGQSGQTAGLSTEAEQHCFTFHFGSPLHQVRFPQ